MSTKTYADIGRLWLPERSLSLPGGPAKRKGVNILVASVRRPRYVSEGFTPEIIRTIRKEDLDPRLLLEEVAWHDVGHNERVDKGGDINITRLFGAASGASTGAGVLTAMAIASSSITVAHGDLSLGSGSANATTNEFTTIGLSRTAATVQNYVATTSLDATVSVDLFKSFSVSGGGTAYGSGIFDSTTVSGSFLFVEKLFASSAVVVNGDTLQVTWTITL